MHVRLEIVDKNQPETAVIRCHELTPEIEAMANLIRRQDVSRQPIVFYKGDEHYYLSLREILFFETDDDHVYAHSAADAFEVKARLYELEAALPGYFVRVSRSAIASILHIYSIQKSLTGVSLVAFRQSHKEIYCSRMYGRELFRKMNERFIYENI
ncbi:MAG: LytTR family DNA-binding domain-containing protein [Eubacteriales bacterium]|nr:LytTR family DNA-binding domain-containing protein [Eubacteriales bacterium]MDD4461701.1 LytTR family DNA-binding domain-containing protein [Eubacteriales bacterium]